MAFATLGASDSGFLKTLSKSAQGAATSATSSAITRMVDKFTRNPGQAAAPAVYRPPMGPEPTPLRTYLMFGGAIVGAIGLAYALRSR